MSALVWTRVARITASKNSTLPLIMMPHRTRMMAARVVGP